LRISVVTYTFKIFLFLILNDTAFNFSRDYCNRRERKLVGKTISLRGTFVRVTTSKSSGAPSAQAKHSILK